MTTTADSGGAGTTSGTQPGAAPLTVFAAPSTGDEFNTIGERLVPKGCFKVEDLLFDFASSFIRPEIAPHLRRLVELRNEHKVKNPKTGKDVFPPLSVFGHADPTGDDMTNKVLSGRRATAFYALLVRDVDLWNELFTKSVGKDDWGTRSIQTMLSHVQAPIGIDGDAGPETRGAIKTFQSSKSLPPDGVANPATRKALFRAYMDAICGPELLLDKKTDFLAQNQDAGGKGDRQGCSEFNPLLLFSKQEAAAFDAKADKTQRDEENGINRRVMVLLFQPGRRVNPAAWPCPRVSEGVSVCKKRFFPDGDVRRGFQAQRRQFEDTRDTFACRFYQVIADDSPCERVKPLPPIPPIRPDVNAVIVFGGSSTKPKSDTVGAGDITSRNFVVVKKPYTTPKRVPVLLKSDKPFEGSGEFTVSDTSIIRFFPDADNLLVMKFDGVQNVFTGEQLSAGVTVFAEGVKASKSVDDVTLTLALSPRFATILSVTRVQITSIDVTLDICAPRTSASTDPVPLPQPTTDKPPAGNPRDKVFGGRTIRVQTPKKTRERAMLIARIQPEAFAATLELQASSPNVSVFNNENASAAGAALTLPHPIDTSKIPAGKGERLFVQGDVLSKAVRDVELQLGVQGVEPVCDRVTMTVTAAVEVILDSDTNFVVDENEPVARFVRVGLWDRAFDSITGNVRNAEAETANFVGGDTRRFYFRVHDPAATGEVKVRFKTTGTGGRDDDSPATRDVSCLETTPGSKFFVSRAMMLVTDTVDQAQTTNSGLPAGNADAGNRNQGQSNHRTRRITVDATNQLTHSIVAEYIPNNGNPGTFEVVPVFERTPEERKRLKVHLVNVRATVGGTPALTAARKASGVAVMRSVYAALGIFVDVDEIVIDPPASCTGWPTRFPGSGLVASDPAVEECAFPAGNLVPSASQQDIINVVRTLPSFDNNDLYVVYVSRIYANPIPPVPPPGGPPGPPLQIGPGGQALPDSWTAAGSTGRSFVFVGVTTVNVLADVHEMTHMTTDLRNTAGGHFDLQAPSATSPGLIDGKNLMQRFVLISTNAISDSKRLWDEPFGNADITPSTIPPQVTAIRASRFIKPF
jgi:hypothetical protein